MNFEDVQSIWSSQSSPESLLDKERLLTSIVAKERSMKRISTATDITMISTLLFLAIMFLRDPVLQGHDLVLIIPALACIWAAALVWQWRVKRYRRQLHFDDSLLGVIDKSIDGIEDYISQLQKFLLWFALPCSIGLTVALFIIAPEKRWLLYTIFIPAFVICIGLAYWQIRREVRLKLEPERKRLEEILAMLNDE